MNTRLLVPAALSLSLLAACAPARAQGVIIPPDGGLIRRPIPRPFPTPQPAPLPLAIKSQKVNMTISSGALKVEVEQVFYNPNSTPAEGTYLFPLPPGAAVSNFRLQIDKEPVEGKMLDKDEARRVYESYVRRNIDPAILEWVGRNAFQARIFPIPAGGERKIFLTYSQPCDFSNGIYKAVYPLNSERVTGQTAGDLTIDCSIKSPQPIKSVYSPTHEIQVKRSGDHEARASYEGKDVRANRDFLLYYTTSEKAFGLNALAHRRAGEDGYAMLMLAPKREVAQAEVQPKDVVLVFDTSGSMQGAKIDQARKAALTILGALNEKDRFNVLRFSTDVTSFRPNNVQASRENVEAAKAFVNDFKAVGGTAIDDALQAGLASFAKEGDRGGRPPFLIFMTDGLPTVGVTEIDKILENSGKAVPKDLRLFTFGVGSDVNTLLLDRLSADNHGSADYVDASEDLETKIGNFYAKIADPVLSNVKLSLDGVTLEETYPSKIPDLFAGTQLLVLGRYKGQGKATVTLTGQINGKQQKYIYDVNLPDRDLGQEFIPKLWAGRRIGFLLEEIRLHGEKAELKDEVIRLSKEHGIVTPYTSYLVEEPGQVPVAGGQPLRAPLDRFGANNLGAVPGSGGFGGGGQGGGGFGGGRGAGLPAGKPADNPSPERLKKSDDYSKSAGGAAKGPATAPDSELKRLYERQSQAAQQARQQAYGYKQSTGSNAVEASRRLRQLKDKDQAEVEADVVREVAGRRFRAENGVWVDDTIHATKDAKAKPAVVLVKYGSDAYFKLVAHKPEWAKWLSAGKQVRLRTGPGTVVEIGEKGKEKLTDAEVKALEK